MTDDQKQDQTESFETYVNKLIDERGFPDLTTEVREQLKQDLLIRLDDFIAARVIAAFSNEDVIEFEKMLKDSKSMEEIQQFTVDHIENYKDFLATTLLEFRAVYLGMLDIPHAKLGNDESPPDQSGEEPMPAPPSKSIN